jgi:hypothetical protein
MNADAGLGGSDTGLEPEVEEAIHSSAIGDVLGSLIRGSILKH